ncbi:hypothetical protein B5S28_g1232 [[Candida] boidinii]|uniref:Unnamed protein product n=1 Tax=Candida boidinii TaxID=5477 RepID=A0ACB5TG73_CANBO|nr:hypothetical protein B5S28_g1232 [[Candida] boidinii]OWB61497.1 hypothetical protein B5S29_g2389 [[Candida] boidinii]OWB77857.1 hypothetical protein B5S32_g2037 [[Candida] boidinii]GME87079.1 unnamed protein product [[Candida] boidinii]GME90941.1 unnamed protein product [[Candida] boidinii]
MGKAEYGSAKYVGQKLKSRGLQKLKFYCQICEKQCRDDNGFKCHIQSKSHLSNLQSNLDNSNNNSKKLIEEYSEKFVSDFIKLLKINHGEKFIGYNKFYQEYINSRDHIHLNSTKWKNLTSFVFHLKENRLCQVEILGEDDGTDGANVNDGERYRIAYIDNSPQSVMKRNQKKKESRDYDDRTSKLLQIQINKAQQEYQQIASTISQESNSNEEKGKFDIKNHEKVTINLSNVDKISSSIENTSQETDVSGDLKPKKKTIGGFSMKKAVSNQPKKLNIFKKKKL